MLEEFNVICVEIVWILSFLNFNSPYIFYTFLSLVKLSSGSVYDMDMTGVLLSRLTELY